MQYTVCVRVSDSTLYWDGQYFKIVDLLDISEIKCYSYVDVVKSASNLIYLQ